MRGKLVHELKLPVRALGFGDGLGLKLSSGHLLLSVDGLGFWVME